MNRNELLELCYQDNKEKKLKNILFDRIVEAGLNKTVNMFIYRNVLTLTKCNIDDISFFNILTRSYILNQYNENNKEDFSMISEFNNMVNNNDYTSAFDMFLNNNTVYETLCLNYMNNVATTNRDKVNSINSKNINEVYNKLTLLNNTKLENKKQLVHTKKQKVSER